MALRNSLAVAVPLAVGIAIGHPLGGIAVTTGALNVAYSDGSDPYAHRARRMLAWSGVGALAVFLGSVTGNYPLLAVVVACAWAFVAGLMVSISTRAGDLGLNTFVTLIVYAARGAFSPRGAFEASLLVLAGGLLQTAGALLFWPLERKRPERRAVGGVYLELAKQAESSSEDLLAAPLEPPSRDVQDTLSALGRDHSLEGERLRLLFDQADRLRFSMYVVSNLNNPTDRALQRLLAASQTLIACLGTVLVNDKPCSEQEALLAELHAASEEIRNSNSPLEDSARSAADVLAGQLRVAAQLTANTTTEGAEQFARYEFAPPWELQMRSWLATLRANLHLRSAACRHALRMAVCVAIADVIGRSLNTERTYWLAMTVAVVLKPDFTTTISRGVLRLAGTFAGLLLATVLFHLLPASAVSQLLLVGAFTFLARYAGPANYGVFTISISGLIVFLIAETGVSPGGVIAQRAINTVAGGVLALLAYALWPTWEKSQVSDVMAEMIDQTRLYFHAIARQFSATGASAELVLDEARRNWREARSNAEASVDRLCSEPGTETAKTDLLTSMLASSHTLVRTMMGMEAGLEQIGPQSTSPEFQTFCDDVEFTLYFLAAALRGSSAATRTLPALREDHRRLLESLDSSHIDDFLLTEADRLTVSLNTLREQVARYTGVQPLHTTIR